MNIKITFLLKETFIIQQLKNKDYQKVWSSPSDPAHFEVDASHKKLEGVFKADSMNFSSFSQDLTHSHFPLYMDTNSTTSDSPQVSVAYRVLGGTDVFSFHIVSHMKISSKTGRTLKEFLVEAQRRPSNRVWFS